MGPASQKLGQLGAPTPDLCDSCYPRFALPAPKIAEHLLYRQHVSEPVCGTNRLTSRWCRGSPDKNCRDKHRFPVVVYVPPVWPFCKDLTQPRQPPDVLLPGDSTYWDNVEAGIASPSPVAVSIANTTPTTRPSLSKSGLPELPGSMAFEISIS